MNNFKEWFALRNENAFYGLRDLQNELNDKINTFLFKSEFTHDPKGSGLRGSPSADQ